MSEKYSKKDIESYRKKINKYYEGIDKEDYENPIEMKYINENGETIQENVEGKFTALNFVYKLIDKVPRPMYNLIFNKKQATKFIRVIEQYILKTRRPNIQIDDKSFPKKLKNSSDEFTNLIRPRLVTKISSIIKHFDITEEDLNEDDTYFVKPKMANLEPLVLPENAPYAPESPDYYSIVSGERKGDESPPYIVKTPLTVPYVPLKHVPIGSVKEMQETLETELKEDLSLLKSKLELVNTQDKERVDKELFDERKYFFFKKKFDVLVEEEVNKMIDDELHLYTEQYNYQIKQMNNYGLFRERIMEFMNQRIVQFRYSILNVRNKYYKPKENMTSDLLLYKKVLDSQKLQNRRKIESLVKRNLLDINDVIKYSENPLSIVPLLETFPNSNSTKKANPKPLVKKPVVQPVLSPILEAVIEPEHVVIPIRRKPIQPRPRQRTVKSNANKSLVVKVPNVKVPNVKGPNKMAVNPIRRKPIQPRPRQRTVKSNANQSLAVKVPNVKVPNVKGPNKMASNTKRLNVKGPTPRKRTVKTNQKSNVKGPDVRGSIVRGPSVRPTPRKRTVKPSE